MNTADINIKTIPRIKNFRTLNGSLSVDDSSLNIAICDVLQEREFLIDESEGLGIQIPVTSMPSINSDSPASWAKAIRNHFSLDISDQFRTKSSRQFYLYLRDKLERKGIFVQCFTDVSLELVRGFSVYQEKLPVIGINDEDRTPAKSFSLIHELVHLIKRESSVCNTMINAPYTLAEEVFCNAVAGELLVPVDALNVAITDRGYKRPYESDDIRGLANRFSVSREVIIRRLFDNDLIDSSEYNAYADAFLKEIERDREEQRLARNTGIKTGFRKSISRDIIDRTSSNVCRLLYLGYSEEVFSKRDIAHHLDISQKHVDKFLAEVSTWSS